jgi:hypothetical protein
VNTERSGFDNLRFTLGADPLDWIYDWLVALYTDDAVPGVGGMFTQLSWNFRDLYPQLRAPSGESYGQYPLRTKALSDGVDEAVTIPAGSAAYMHFRVDPGQRAEIRIAGGAGSCRESGPAHSMETGEVLRLAEADAASVCLDAGADGGEFVLIPIYTADGGSRQVSVRALGIASPSYAEAANHRMTRDGGHGVDQPRLTRDWELQFRQQEQNELADLIQAASSSSRPSYSVSSATGALRAAIVRTN